MSDLLWRIAVIIACVTCFVTLGVITQEVYAAELTRSVGETTKIAKSIAHTKGTDKYAMETLGARFDNGYELSIVKHKYHVKGDHFSTVSFGLAKHWRLERSIFFIDLGLGLRYTERDHRIKWLRYKHLMSDFSGAIGLKLWGDFGKASVGLRHFSCPGSDTGQNLDEITVTFNVPF